MSNNLKFWTRDFFRGIKVNWILSLSYLFFLPIMLLIDYRYIIISSIRNNIQLSIADFFIVITSPRSATIIMPVTIIVFFFLIERDFNFLFILQEKSRKKIWLKQVYKAGVFSVFNTAYVCILTYFIGGFYSTSYINWDIKKSIFYYETKAILTEVTFLKVTLCFFLVYLLRMILMCLLALIIYWIIDKKIISIVVVMAINIFERNAVYIYIFNKVISIDYELWVKPQSIQLGILYGVVLIFIITLLGKYISKRKEFLNG